MKAQREGPLPWPQPPSRAHLSFLRSPRDAGLTAILGSVEAEAWDWLQEDKVSTLSGDCGGVLHSECDSDPAGEGVWSWCGLSPDQACYSKPDVLPSTSLTRTSPCPQTVPRDLAVG